MSCLATNRLMVLNYDLRDGPDDHPIRKQCDSREHKDIAADLRQ
jgi:hypothetical protein